MKKLVLAAVLALSLGGCASLQKTWDVITGVTVSPTQIVVAANAFDAAEVTATQYRLYCRANPAMAPCAVATQLAVKHAVLSGRAVRNQLEPYIVSGTAGPAALYNALVTIVTNLQTQIPVAPGAVK